MTYRSKKRIECSGCGWIPRTRGDVHRSVTHESFPSAGDYVRELQRRDGGDR